MINIRLIFVFLILLSSIAPVASAADYRFGELTGVDCRPGLLFPGCQIAASDFIDPVIFLMPTIDQTQLDQDLPATLRVLGKTWNKTFYVVQDTAPESVSSNYSSNPMTNIQYLIVEKGKTITFDGGAFYADTVNTDKQIRSGYTYDIDAHNYPWHEFPRQFDDENNVVITELQSAQYNAQYKPVYWLTSDPIHIEDDGFHSGLERTELGYTNYLRKPLAYLVGYGEGYLEGDNYISFSMGSSYQPMRWSNSYVDDSCQHEIDLGTTFDSEPYLFTRSQWRLGSVGGWTRHCKGTKSSVFVTIEDMLYLDGLRKNNYQPTGTLAYGLKTRDLPPFDTCKYFPEPAQSWKNDSEIEFDSYKSSSSPYPYFIGGWSSQYVADNSYTSEGKTVLKIGFKDVEHNGDDSDTQNDWSCQVGRCDSSSNRLSTPEKVTPNFPSSGDLDLGSWNYESQCPSDNSGQYCSHEVDTSTGDIIITIKSDLKKLKVQGISSNKKMVVKFTAQGGERGRLIGEYETNSNVRSIFDNSGIYSFKKIKFNTNTELEIGSSIIWKVKEDIDFSGAVSFSSNGNPDDFVIYAPKGDVKFHTVNGDFYGLILAKKLTLENNITIFGAVTTNELEIKTSGTTIVGQSSCFSPSPTPEVSRIEVKPFNYHLTCEESPSNIVEVHVFDENDHPISGYVPTLTESNGNSLNISFISESNGIVLYRVVKSSSGSIGDYPLTASLLLSDGSTVTDTDDIKFVPYKFDVADTHLFAGEENQITVNVKACSNSGQLIELGYTGSPSSSFSYNQPASAQVDVSDLEFTANLSDSNRLADLTFLESGHITVSIEDSSFVCNEERCPIEGGSLKGEFDVYSRPWKIAICNVESGGENNPASGATGGGFVSAGTGFSVDYRPIVHPDSATGIADECDYSVTSNYSLDNGPLVLDFEVVYPDSSLSPQPGIVTPNVIPSFSSNNELNTLVHTWSEVGSIEFITSAVYLGRDVEEDRQVIGRFYPDYFNTLNNDWEDPAGQAFTYMNQEFENVAVEVAAYNTAGNETQNYGDFNSIHQAFFDLDEGRLLNGDNVSISSNSSYQSSRWALNSSEILWQKQADFSPDGPFNFAGGDARSVSLNIFTATLSDPVQFKTVPTDPDGVTTQQLPDEQPRVVFGRVNLSDVGGVEGSDITVPLQVQYWTDDAFINNVFDSFTDVEAEIDGNPTVIWPVGGETTVNFTGSADVAQGIANGLVASQNVATREQVEIFQRLDSGTNDMPWLMFDWDQDGADEENPSTIVTFGIHRGNDRVIFRGEPGL